MVDSVLEILKEEEGSVDPKLLIRLEKSINAMERMADQIRSRRESS